MGSPGEQTRRTIANQFYRSSHPTTNRPHQQAKAEEKPHESAIGRGAIGSPHCGPGKCADQCRQAAARTKPAISLSPRLRPLICRGGLPFCPMGACSSPRRWVLSGWSRSKGPGLRSQIFRPRLHKGQGGMLGVFLSPHYAKDHDVYLTYSEPGDDGSSLALARARLKTRAGFCESRRTPGDLARWRKRPGRAVRRSDSLFARWPLSVPQP